MDLVEVDVIRSEPSQTGIHLHENRPARQTGAIRTRSHAAPDLGGEHDIVALREFLERPPHDLFAGANRINVRRVEEIDPGLERLGDERTTVALIECPRLRFARRRAIAHTAQTDAGYFEPRMAKPDIVHRVLLVGSVRIPGD